MCNAYGWWGLGDIGHVASLVAGAGTLYAGGNLFVAKWTGAVWETVPVGGATGPFIAPWVDTLVVDSAGNLYIGGEFLNVAGMEANNIAVGDARRWYTLGSGVNSLVRAMVLDHSNRKLYVSGYFTTAGSKVAPFVAEADVSRISDVHHRTTRK